MASKAPAPAWLKLPTSEGHPALVIASARTAVGWRGRGGDRMRITFQYWQRIVSQLPDELRPTQGHPDTPHLTVPSADEAKRVIAKLKQFVATLHPEVTETTHKASGTTRLLAADDIGYHLVVQPESAGEVTLEAMGETVPAMRCPVGDAEALVWQVFMRDVRARATPDEITFVSSAVAIKGALDTLEGDATDHGLFTFDGALVGMWIGVALADLKGLAAPDAASLVALAGTVVKAKKAVDGGAIVLPARGTYRALSGQASAELRWLKLVRP